MGPTMLAWRLAGNLPRLQQGTPVNPWASQREDEWVPAQTLQVSRRETIRASLGTALLSASWQGRPARCESFISGGRRQLG